MKMNGADAILRSLEAEGVDVMFGIPGGAIMTLAVSKAVEEGAEAVICASTVASAADATTGLPPNVEPWSPGTKPGAARSPARSAPMDA